MIYFDYTATQLIDEDVLAFYINELKENNYNPAAIYRSGLAAANSITKSKKEIGKLLGCQPEELIITSGATESINMAIKGLLFSPNPKHKRILTTGGEHPATIETLKFAERKLGYTIDICSLNAEGQVDLEKLEGLLAENSYDLLSIIHVNNVLGTINPIDKIVDLKNQYQKDTPIHLDSVQALGKIPLDFKKMKVELASFSLHKIGAPKGIGLLYKNKKIRLEALIHGGGQQDSLRSGTENPALVATAAYAIGKAINHRDRDYQATLANKNYLQEALVKANIDHQFVIANSTEVVPHINAILFPRLRAETLLNVLNAEGIAVSIGSACSNKKSEQNPILKNLRLPGKMDKHILRISLSKKTSQAEIDILLAKIAEALDKYAI